MTDIDQQIIEELKAADSAMRGGRNPADPKELLQAYTELRAAKIIADAIVQAAHISRAPPGGGLLDWPYNVSVRAGSAPPSPSDASQQAPRPSAIA